MRSLNVYSLLVAGLCLSYAQASAVDSPTATIQCPVSEEPGDLRWAQGNIRFSDGFSFYGPARNKIQGEFSFRLPKLPTTGSSIVHVSMKGNHIRGEHYNSPDYWILTGIAESGEAVQFYLEQSRQSQEFAYGEIYLANGQEFRANCSVKF